MDIPCVGAIVRDEAGRILVVLRGRAPGKGQWSIPGGRVEPGEAAVDAVRREVHEETGLDVQVGAVAGAVVLDAPAAGDRYVVTDFFATLAPGDSSHPVAGDDATDARWVDAAGFLELDLTPDLATTLESWHVWPQPPAAERSDV